MGERPDKVTAPPEDTEAVAEGEARKAQVARRRVAGSPTVRQAGAAAAAGTGAGPPVAVLVEAVRRIEDLLTILVRRAVRPALEEELKDSTARAIYEATGEKTAREIAQATRVSVATVSRTWTRWEALGLVVKDGTRYRRLF